MAIFDQSIKREIDLLDAEIERLKLRPLATSFLYARNQRIRVTDSYEWRMPNRVKTYKGIMGAFRRRLERTYPYL